MAEEEKETQEPNTEEDKTSKNEEEDKTSKPEEKEETPKSPKENESALAQKEHFRKKFEQTQSDLEAANEELEGLRKKATSPKSKSDDSGDDVSRFLEIREATEGLDAKAISELRLRADAQYGGDLRKAREDENFKTWLDAEQEKVRKANNTLEPSSPSSKAKDSSVKPGMSKEEHRKAFEEDLRRKEGGGSEV